MIWLRIIAFFICSALSCLALLQTPWAQDKIARKLESLFSDHGLEITIGSIEGHLPLNCTMHHLLIGLPDQESITIEELRIRLDLASLCRRVLRFAHVEACGIYGKQLPIFDLSCSVQKIQERWHLTHIQAKREESELAGTLDIAADGTFEKGCLYLYKVDIPKFLNKYLREEIKGQVSGKFLFCQNHLSFDGTLETIEWAHLISLPILEMKTEALARASSLWDINLKLHSLEEKAPFVAAVSGQCNVRSLSFHLPEIQMDVLGAKCIGHLKMGEDKSMGGCLHLQIPELEALKTLLPSLTLHGKLEAKIDLAPTRGGGLAEAYLTLEDVGFLTTQIGRAEGSLTFLKNGKTYEGKSTLSIENISTAVGTLAQGFISTTFNQKEGEFECDAQGYSYGNFELESHGHFSASDAHINTTIDRLNGELLGKNFHTKTPILIDISRERLLLSNSSLQLGEGEMTTHLDLTPSSAIVKMRGEKLPLQLLQYLGLRPQIEGNLSLDTSLICLENHVEGYFKSSLENESHIVSQESTIPIRGWLMAELHRETAQIQSELRVFGDQYASFTATVPVHYVPEKYQLLIKNDLPLSAYLAIEGDFGEVGALFHPLGSHLSGKLSCRLFFSKPFNHLQCTGPIELQQGSYINDILGLALRNITVKGHAKERQIIVDSFEAMDDEKGYLSAFGTINLMEPRFPYYTFNIELEKFHMASSDFLRSTFSGSLTLQGDTKSASLQGDVFAHEIHIKIPEQMPAILPNLEITYVNFPQKTHATPPLRRYPLYLDLDVAVEERFYVTGKGLNSQWKGKLHMKGTPLEPQPSGHLSLIDGEYLFAGKLFTLNQGEIGLSARSESRSAIQLSGSCELPNMVAKAILRGPLTSPTLSFQSTPPMSTSDLLSHILFDHSPDEISPIQGLQLAQTLLNLSGASAVNPFEKIRNLLRIDRLNIAASKQDPTKLAVEIGKYIAKGVLISFSQNGQRSEISMQAGLAPGIVLQAEVGQEQHGKLSLKWHYDY